jgi:hypothetical protein
MEELKYSKRKQLNPTGAEELDREELEKRAKLHCVALYEAYIFETGLSPFDFKILDPRGISHEFLMSLDWDHIRT